MAAPTIVVIMILGDDCYEPGQLWVSAVLKSTNRPCPIPRQSTHRCVSVGTRLVTCGARWAVLVTGMNRDWNQTDFTYLHIAS